MKRADVLRLGLAALGVPAATAALAACGAAGQDGGGQLPAKPAAPVEIEYWGTLAETHVTEKARRDGLTVSQRANPDYFKMKFGDSSAGMPKITAAVSAGTP